MNKVNSHVGPIQNLASSYRVSHLLNSKINPHVMLDFKSLKPQHHNSNSPYWFQDILLHVIWEETFRNKIQFIFGVNFLKFSSSAGMCQRALIS